MTDTATTTDRVFHRTALCDRQPEHLPLAKGWDWHQYRTDGKFSTISAISIVNRL